ncbi:MAG TPA: RNA polymerase sigma factor [Chitinophagaceae bacterium]|nr:RNA polymerase sigma factor [Chitinophagaceae bacterium]MCB9056305.1 RNA polymerase sigma factor [Chitinophagales bacterium]HPG10896.1 RNA polymerase sigma factor [Chitinophagaceae bacterium]HRX93231.1 RNA polymerase sigma factor [Chitinophagaceae bacterium]
MSAGFNDNEIISNVLKGNQAAYAELVEKYSSYVFSLCIKVVRSREDAEEIAQDVFVKAYKYLADFKGNSKFSTWLYTIANNTAISFLRKRKLNVASLDNEKVFETADMNAGHNQVIMAEQKSKANMVTKAINMLNPDDAAIINLFYKGEQTLEEIAMILGIETNTAKVRLHRARTRLKEKMETYFSHEVKDLN